jgi:imidazolonepropionase-like amidohydrolase
MTRLIHTLLACTLFLLAPTPARSQQAPTLVIRNAIVVDGSGSPAAGPKDIIIRGNRIVSIVSADPVSIARRGPGFERPTGDRVIDATGMYVLPGLIDMHAHIAADESGSDEYQLSLYVASGVTSVRHVGGNFQTLTAPFHSVELERRRRAGEIVSPRIFSYPFWPSGAQAPTVEADVRALVRSFKERGADGIKLHSLYPDVMEPLMDEVRKVGLGTAAHLGQDGASYIDVEIASEDGIRTIEHHYAQAEPSLDRTVENFPGDYNYMHEPDRFHHSPDPWLEADPAKFSHTLDVLLENGTVLDPTFVVYEPFLDMIRARNLPYYRDYLSPFMRDYWTPRAGKHGSTFDWTTYDEVKWAEMFRRWMAFVNEFKNRGGHVTTGSDSGNSYTLYGFSLVREMELLQHAGFHPLEVVRSATSEGARALGQSELGLLRPGYLADLIVVDGNPLANLQELYASGMPVWDEEGHMTRRGGIRYTIIDGHVYDAKAILADVARMVREGDRQKEDTRE